MSRAPSRADGVTLLSEWESLLQGGIAAFATGVPDAEWLRGVDVVAAGLQRLSPAALRVALTSDEGRAALDRIGALSEAFGRAAAGKSEDLAAAVRALDDGRRALKAYASSQGGGPFFINKGY